MNPKDLFSGHAQQYAAFRPDYPGELFEFIFKHVKDFSVAWDCATGNGQAAKELINRFKKVYATDISERQMVHGFHAENIEYSVSAAEKTNFPDNTFDLITVAQSAHWFTLDEFYAEVNRVGKPGCVLAIWGYGLLSVNPEFDTMLQRFYKEIIGTYWDRERKLIDELYQTIPFPFHEIQSPGFSFTRQWDFNHIQGYLNTWSAVQKYVKANQTDPVSTFTEESRLAFGYGQQNVTFPLFLRLGIIEK